MFVSRADLLRKNVLRSQDSIKNLRAFCCVTLFQPCYSIAIALCNLSIAVYAQTFIIVSIILVKLFSLLVISSQGVGVTTWESGRIFLLCLLYLPIPIRGQRSSNRPQFVSPKIFEKISKKSFSKSIIKICILRTPPRSASLDLGIRLYRQFSTRSPNFQVPGRNSFIQTEFCLGKTYPRKI